MSKERYYYLRPEEGDEGDPVSGIFVDFRTYCPFPTDREFGQVDITGRAPGYEGQTISVTVDGQTETTTVAGDSTWGFTPWPHSLPGSEEGITYDVLAEIGGDTDQTNGEITVCEPSTWVWVDGGPPYSNDHWWVNDAHPWLSDDEATDDAIWQSQV